MIQGSDGSLYGTTQLGGDGSVGTVFKVDTSGTLTTLHSFTGGDGAEPVAGLIQGSDGTLYGTTSLGGAANAGTVFKVDATGTLTTLYSFTGGSDGAHPAAGLLRASDGRLYGTTRDGGSSSLGTVFALQDDTLTTLYTFAGLDGAYPVAGLIEPSPGLLYGTTSQGGASNMGVVFRITVTAGSAPSAVGVAPAVGTLGGTTTLSATLTTSGTPIAGKAIAFTLNGTGVGRATTDASGVARATGVSLVGINAGTHPGAVQASFAGDSSFVAAAASADLVVTLADTYGPAIPIASPAVCVAVPSGLVGWWSGEGDASDRLGRSPGTLQNGATFGGGKAGQGFSFPGTGTVLVQATADLDLSTMTLEAWILTNSVPPSSAVFSVAAKGVSSTSENFGLYVLQTGELYFEWYNGAFHYGQSTAANLTPGAFHHVAVTADGATLKFYVDGQAVGEAVQTAPLVPNGLPLQIGSALPYDNRFDGVIDELAIYNRALAAGEIQSVYLADTAGKCVPAATSLVVSPTAGVSGGTTTVSATLTSMGSPVSGEIVSFTLRGAQVGSASTDGGGVATLTGVSMAGIGAGAYPGAVQASFAGDASFATTSGSADLVVTLPDTTPPVLSGVPSTITLPATTIAGRVDSAVGDFTIASNPSGKWSYGYTDSVGGTFSLLTDTMAAELGYLDSWLGPSGFPKVEHNSSGTTHSFGSVNFPADALIMHPAAGAESVVRWTAPAGGTYAIQGFFEGQDFGGPTSTDVHIRLNSSTALWDSAINGTLGNGYGVPLTFALTQTLAGGDTIDFVVGNGGNGYFFDSTGLVVTIASTDGGGIGAVATWASPSAFDAVDGARPVTCVPASGSLFPVGASVVICSAADTRGNIASARFDVVVTETPVITWANPADIVDGTALREAHLIHQYRFNGSYADDFGGPALVAQGGTLGADGYAFGRGQGLTLSNAIDPWNYSIVFHASLANVSGYRKLLDLANLTVDTGLYSQDGSLRYFPADIGPSGAIPADTKVQIALTRDGATQSVAGYVNGVLQFSFHDSSGLATLTGPVLSFFIDDGYSNHAEASAGVVDGIQIYNGALNADEIAALGPIGSQTSPDVAQLNATANVPGVFAYTPPAGTVLPVGTHTLSATFTPSNATTYTVVTATVNITVLPAGTPTDRPPVAAAAAAPNPAEATGPGGAAVQLDGTGSSDPDSDPLTFTWLEGATTLGSGSTLSVGLPLGPHTITLIVNDGRGQTASADVIVTVSDTTPPSLSGVPSTLTVEADERSRGRGDVGHADRVGFGGRRSADHLSAGVGIAFRAWRDSGDVLGDRCTRERGTRRLHRARGGHDGAITLAADIGRCRSDESARRRGHVHDDCDRSGQRRRADRLCALLGERIRDRPDGGELLGD